MVDRPIAWHRLPRSRVAEHLIDYLPPNLYLFGNLFVDNGSNQTNKINECLFSLEPFLYLHYLKRHTPLTWSHRKVKQKAFVQVAHINEQIIRQNKLLGRARPSSSGPLDATPATSLETTRAAGARGKYQPLIKIINLKFFRIQPEYRKISSARANKEIRWT